DLDAEIGGSPNPRGEAGARAGSFKGRAPAIEWLALTRPKTEQAVEGAAEARPRPAVPPPTIPMVDTRRDYEALRPEIDRAVPETLASGEYCLGSQTEAFEAEAARYL